MIPRSWCWPACFPEETGFISRGWVYSSELRVLNTQWIRALLFRFTDSWTAVRVVGNLVLDGWLLGAYRFFVGQLTEKKNWFWYTAPFLLLPFSHEAFYVMGEMDITYRILRFRLRFWVCGCTCTGERHTERQPICSCAR